MTEQDARVVCRIMATADGECTTCVARLLEWFGRKYPEHQAIAIEAFAAINGSPGRLDFASRYTDEWDREHDQRGHANYLEIMGMATGPRSEP